MAIGVKRLGALVSSGVIGTADILYGCTNADSAVVSTIAVCNRAATPATYRICVYSANSFNDAGYVVYDATVPANNTIFLTLGLVLDTYRSFLLCSASATTVSFSAFGQEINPYTTPPAPAWQNGSWTGSTVTVPSGVSAGDLVIVVVHEGAGPNDYFDDPAISSTWTQWASRGAITWGRFTHDGRASYTISTDTGGGAFVFVTQGTTAYDNLVDEGSTTPIEWYSESGETYSLTGNQTAHLVCAWASEDYDAGTVSLGIDVLDNPVSPIPSPMHSIALLPLQDYWYAFGVLAIANNP